MELKNLEFFNKDQAKKNYKHNPKKFTEEEYLQLNKLVKNPDFSISKIGKIMNRGASTISYILDKCGGREYIMKNSIDIFSEIKKNYKKHKRIPTYITYEQACKIKKYINNGYGIHVMGKLLNLSRASIKNFINQGGGPENFNPEIAYKKRKAICASYEPFSDTNSEDLILFKNQKNIQTSKPQKNIELVEDFKIPEFPEKTNYHYDENENEFEFSDEELPSDLKKLHETTPIPINIPTNQNPQSAELQMITETVNLIINQLNYLQKLITQINK